MNAIELTRTTSTDDQQLVELVEEITARLQGGEPCDVDAYAARYPAYADRLRDWMTVMTAMADLGHSIMGATAYSSPPPSTGEGLGEGAGSGATAGCSELAVASLPSSAQADGSKHSPPRYSGEGLGEGSASAGLLGDFRILREVGRGGMGVVYEAEQISLGRRVALKVLPFAAMLDRQQLARFKNEARAAATLDHPNIVAIHSVGCERSVHYYAMQLIEGQSLAQAIDQLRRDLLPLPPGEGRGEGALESAIRNPESGIETQPIAALPTLHASSSLLPAVTSRDYFRTIAQLGIQASNALDHAHQNGVLHRDIKPANLLVECNSKTPSPSGANSKTPSPLGGGPGRGCDDASHLKLWITDFGLARIEQDAGMTMTGDILGTLRYMSPEQALAKRVVVDHRSDIYSLGVTLYELLTLQPAYAAHDRQELLRQIAFEDPRKPRQINKRIPQDLETIVLKTIEKNPADRYLTAEDLANELRRFLNDQPIKAKSQSLITKARKWSRRHRGLLGASAVVLVLLTIASLITTILLWRERQRTAVAAAESKAIADFLVNDVLTAQFQQGIVNRDVKVSEALANAEPRLATAFAEQPLVEMRIRQVIANVYNLLGKYDLAESHARRVLKMRTELVGAVDPRTLFAIESLAKALIGQRKYDEAIRISKKSLNDVRHDLGIDQPETVLAMKSLVRIFVFSADSLSDSDVDFAIKLCEETLASARRLLGPDRIETLGTAYDLGLLLRVRGRNTDALRIFDETLAENRRLFGRKHFMTTHLMQEVAQTLGDLGRTDAAAKGFQEVLETRRHHGGNDWWTLECMLSLARVQSRRGKNDEAYALFKEALEISRQAYDARHPIRHKSTYMTAWFLATASGEEFRDGRRALEMASEACELTEYKDAHAMDALAAGYAELGDFEAAVKWSEKALTSTKLSALRQQLNKHLESYQASKPWREL